MKEGNRHVRALEPATLVISLLMAAFAAVICMQIISRIGITPNTSIVGAILAMILARIPFGGLTRFRSLERQNLVQTMASAGGFAAANCGLLAVGIVFLLGQPNLVIPMLIGSALSTLIGIWFACSLYDSDVYPAAAAWPPGVATAEALIAGDEGGHRAMRLVQGILLGVVGTHFKLPMAGIGIVFIANIFAMASLGVGLVIRGYSPLLLGIDLGKTYIPHGVMIGAGFISLLQALAIINRGSKRRPETPRQEVSKEKEVQWEPTVTGERVKQVLGHGTLLYLGGAVVMALVAGIVSQMTAVQLLIWVVWAGLSAVIAAVLVGLSAMHSGWFPGFAISVIFLTIGMFLKIPALPLALLTGYVASAGPCFADLGYDLKTGWLLRGRGKDVEYELDGRRQQLIAELVGGLVAMVVVFLFMNMHFKLDMLPPVSRVFAATVKAGANPDILRQLIIWAIPGAILQGIGGSGKAMGILFATGLLIQNPIYGIGVLAAVVVRLVFGTKFMEVRDAGLIAGDGIYGFVSAVVRTMF
ncbi:MAG: hypothetical protein PWR31_1144 [Bacillota bacterium]|nr:hypothetical protein [Bacillota bacterium]